VAPNLLHILLAADNCDTGLCPPVGSIEAGPGVGPGVVDAQEQHREDPEQQDGVGDGDVFLVELNVFGDEWENHDEDVLEKDEEVEECLRHEGVIRVRSLKSNKNYTGGKAADEIFG